MALVVCGTAGCGAPQTMYGLVRASHDRCASRAGGLVVMGAPLAGASVSVRCPGDDAPHNVVPTNADGHFEGDWTAHRPIPLRCVIHVEKDGYVPRDVRVADACASPSQRDHQEPACWTVVIVAELTPAGSAS